MPELERWGDGIGIGGVLARPAVPGPHPGIVVLMEAFGLTRHIERVCERLANVGYVALAPDLYRGKRYGYEELSDAIQAMRGLDDDQAIDDIGAALDALAGRDDVEMRRLAVVGLCMGGRLAFLSACRHAPRLGAVAAFYGGSIAPEADRDRFGRTPPIGEAEALASPLLLVYGAQDSSIPPAEHARVAERLSALNKRYTLSVYPGAEHGFCCEERASYAPEAAAAAWRELLDFLERAFAAI